MALSKYPSYIEDMLTCSVCLDLIKEPTTLQACLHSYCKTCVDDLLRRQSNRPPGVKCPICQSFSKQVEIRSNFFINDLLDARQNILDIEAGKKKYCQQCPENDPQRAEAKFSCLDCKLMLCQRCQLLHLNVPVLKGHRILGLNKDTELVIDKLVFCQHHEDEVIKFYCKECKSALCIMCKVTVHDTHPTETVETALGHLVPQIKESTKYLDASIKDVDKSIKRAGQKIAEITEVYSKCSKEIKCRSKEMIEKIKAEEKQLERELQKKKVEELKKIEQVKEELENKKKEDENVKQVVNTSLERARHATLLTELVQSQIQEKLHQYKKHKSEPINVEVKAPKFRSNLPIKEQKLLGEVEYYSDKISFNRKGFETRLYDLNFDEVLSKPRREITIVELAENSNCRRMCIIKEQVWITDRENNQMLIHNKDGKSSKVIALKGIDTPRSVVQVQSDIVISSKSGIYHYNVNTDTSTQIIQGEFTNLCGCNDKIYCLGYSNKIEVLSKNEGIWSKERVIGFNTDKHRFYDDTLIAVPSSAQQAEHSQQNLCFYVALCLSHTLIKLDRNGTFIKQYSGKPNMCFPYICGANKDGKLLIANGTSKMGKVLDTHKNTYTDVTVPELTGVCDIILDVSDGQQCMWALGYNIRKNLLVKYEIKS